MCGVVGLIGTRDASREAFLALTTLQHRGQDAAGILTFDETGFHRAKNLGLVESVFNRENMEPLTGNMAIGHARYATIGRGDLGDVQPFVISYPYGLGMAHNGNIVNVEKLAHELRTRSKRHLLTHSDTEVVLNLLADGLARSSAGLEDASGNVEHDKFFQALCSAVGDIFERVNGSYSIVSLVAEQGIVAFRDPVGFRPLMWGKRKGGDLPSGETHVFASESVSLPFLGYDVVRDVKPGELIFVDMTGKVHSKVLKPAAKSRPCMFEWVYFSSPESELDKVPVYGARIQLGKQLAAQIKRLQAKGELQADLIVPVPETSRIAAIAMAEELGIPYREVLIKNRYIKRTFILDSHEKRQKAVNLKLSPVRSEIEGKRVILVDDSIVRGTTSKKIIDLVRQAGAEKVYFVSTCPPIQHPCYYGIDFPNSEELVAAGRNSQQIEKELGADRVIYQDLDGLRRAIHDAAPRAGIDLPCMACLDGNYPTEVSTVGGKFAESRKLDRKAKG